MLSIGLGLTASSLIFQGVSYSQFGTSKDDYAQLAFKAAYVPMGLGLFTILAGILTNPSPARNLSQ
jgi:hypothetical protein